MEQIKTELMFADDMAVLGETEEHLQCILNILNMTLTKITKSQNKEYDNSRSVQNTSKQTDKQYNRLTVLKEQ